MPENTAVKQAKTKPESNEELPEICRTFVDLDKRKTEYKEFLESYKVAVSSIVDAYGVGFTFQDADGVVYKVAMQEGKFVYFEPVTVVRTRRDGEKKGSLSMKEAGELGFTLPVAQKEIALAE